MNKIILLSIAVGSYMFAGIHGEADNSKNQSNMAQYSWVEGSDDVAKTDASRRRGKGSKGRRRGGSGLK